MARKPNSMYRYITQHAYTRREYTGGVPASRLLQFEAGNQHQDYPIIMELVTNERAQFRSQALEAARIAAGRHLEKRVGRSNFFFKIRVFPHHILRENKQATGAGADRVSQGMRRAFGGNVGLAARADQDQAIIELRTNLGYLPACKEALRKASMKLPTPCRIEYTKGAELALKAAHESAAPTLTAEEKALAAAAADAKKAKAAAEHAAEGGAEGEKKGDKKPDAKGEKKPEAKAEKPKK